LDLGCDLGVGLRASLLLFPANSPLKSLSTCAFNFAIWHLRTHYLIALPAPPPEKSIISRLIGLALRRTPTNKHKLKEATVANLARSPPPDALAAFTDGSALGNPGPCGGGYIVYLNQVNLFDRDIPLGHGDNNLGEMGALHGLMEDLILRLSNNSLPPGTIIIFTDSAGCVGYLDRGWAQPSTTSLSRATRTLWNQLKKLRTSRLFWIRGHSGIAGNDEADRLAKIAANKSKAALEEVPIFGGPPLPYSTLIPPIAGKIPKRRREDSFPAEPDNQPANAALIPDDAGAYPPLPSPPSLPPSPHAGRTWVRGPDGHLRRIEPLDPPD
jgi:ribonuclease HI